MSKKNRTPIEVNLPDDPSHPSQKSQMNTQDGKLYTTPRAIADEQLILRLEAEGWGTLKPMMEAGEAQSFLKGSSLTLEQ